MRTTDDMRWYIDYFDHMEAEHKRLPLGGMAWSDVIYHASQAVAAGLFTRDELSERWPQLF